MRKHRQQVIRERPKSTLKEKPIWRFDKLDRSGKFAFDLSRKDFDCKEVLQKLIEYGDMTWDDIGKQQHDYSRRSKHHYLDISSLSKDALIRIRECHLLEETETIYSFSLQNLLRIIGLRRGAEFHIVWFDPKHEFCPTNKK